MFAHDHTVQVYFTQFGAFFYTQSMIEIKTECAFFNLQQKVWFEMKNPICSQESPNSRHNTIPTQNG